MPRFRLRTLQVTGAGKETAAVDFGDGLTFITGLSDTGKSYILECVDFALSKGAAPRSIPEAEGYDRVRLEIGVNGDVRTIDRPLGGSDEAIVFDGPISEWTADSGEVLKVNISPKKPEATLSGRLLQWAGFDPDTPIVKNQRGVTQALSFRTIAPFVLVDEERVIKKTSPILPEQTVQQTAARSAFQILLTGTAPSKDEITKLQEAHKEREEAQQESTVLERLIDELREEIAEEETDRQLLEKERSRIDRQLAEVSETVSRSGDQVRTLLAERNEALASADAARDLIARSSELAERFSLLGEHYRADVRRLEFVLEGGHFFNQLDASHCPYCGQELKSDTGCSRHPESADFEQIERASRAEIKKLAPKMDDLEQAVLEASEQEAAARSTLKQSVKRAKDLDTEIKEVANPTAASARKRVEKLSERRAEIEKQLLPHRQLARYVEALQEASLAADRAISRFRPGYAAESVRSFTDQVSDLLETWKFPFSDLSYSADTNDLVIDGKPRGSSGKGVRAVTHAAFVIGLMRHCLEKDTPHPGFVVIDTPLRHFKGLQDDEDDPQLTRDLKEACLYSLSTASGQGQTVIIDNDDPPTAIKGVAKIYDFTGSEGDGRRGFYPVD